MWLSGPVVSTKCKERAVVHIGDIGDLGDLHSGEQVVVGSSTQGVGEHGMPIAELGGGCLGHSETGGEAS